MRGEHDSVLLLMAAVLGSSPHARGAHLEDARVDALAGIIPACAGSTVRAREGKSRREDHPRMRGEHMPRVCQRVVERGSSPHARGALPSRLTW